ncbi:MAG: TVP38/TMEM64 family protein [Caulobacter sp.]|nr:TVP38/TMEM64 family protein [Caulobacter sp.]
MNMRGLGRYWPVIILVALVAALLLSGASRYLSLDSLQAHEALLRGLIADHLVLSLLLFIGVYALATAASLPGALILTLAGGFLFGTWVGGGATIVGATLGAMLVFYAVRTSFGHALREKAEAGGGRLKAMMDGIKDGAFGYILSLRLLPVAPFWLVNVAAGVAHAPVRAYLLATFFGIMPATFIYSGIGAGLGTVLAHGGKPNLGLIFEPTVLLPLVALGLLSLGTTIVRGVLARRRKAS